MKTQAHRLEASINSLFRRYPALCGFTVEEAGGICIGEITINPLAGPHGHKELYGEIVATLGALLDEYPGAAKLLRERTFARVLH
jgi:hypothetical protein